MVRANSRAPFGSPARKAYSRAVYAATHGTPTPTPTPTPSPTYLLDYNPGASSYIYDGTTYADEAALLTAIGGTNGGGIKRLIGPYVSPASPELCPNGDVHDGTTGWVAGQVSGGPASIAAVGGELQMTTTVAASRPVGAYPFPVQEGKAYLATAKVRKDAAASFNAKFSVSNDITNLNGPACGSSLVGSTALTAVPARNFAPMAGVTTMYGTIYGQSGSFLGMLAIDDLSVKEARPFNGWLDGGISGIVEGVTPAAAGAADKIIWQTDDNALDGTAALERNYIRLCYDSTGHLRLKVFAQTVLGNNGAQQANIDMGAVAVSTAFKVQFLVTKGIAFISLNDAASLSDTPANMPGLAVMRVGAGQVATTNDWDGTITRVSIFPTLTPPPDKTLDIIPLNGDSYGSGFGPRLATATGAAVNNVSVGGSTIALELTYRQNNPLAAPVPANVFWDGDCNGYGTVSNYLAIFDEIIALCGGPERLIAMPPIKRASTTIDNADRDLMAAGMASRLGDNFIDAQAIFAANGDGSGPDNTAIANGYCPPSLLSDGVHPTAAAYGYVATAVAARWNVIK
jgi:hypothetical protein